MDCSDIIFSGHAVRRMFERSLSRRKVISALSSGEVIADYPGDHPYPSLLVLGFVEGTPVHVVVARDTHDSTCIVITAYIPDADLWVEGFRERRR